MSRNRTGGQGGHGTDRRDIARPGEEMTENAARPVRFHSGRPVRRSELRPKVLRQQSEFRIQPIRHHRRRGKADTFHIRGIAGGMTDMKERIQDQFMKEIQHRRAGF